MVRWTELRMTQEDPEETQMKRLLDGEVSAGVTPEFFYNFAPMTFDINGVARFNKSHDKRFTTLRFTDGDVCVVDIPYESFRELYIRTTGAAVHSTISDEQMRAAAKGPISQGRKDSISNSDEFDIQSGI